METAGLVLGVIGVIMPLIQGVNKIIDIYGDMKDAPKEWSRCHAQLCMFVVELGPLKDESVLRAIIGAYQNTLDSSPATILLNGLELIKRDVEELTRRLEAKKQKSTNNPSILSSFVYRFNFTLALPRLQALASRTETWIFHYSTMLVVAFQLNMRPVEIKATPNDPAEGPILLKLSHISKAATAELSDASAIVTSPIPSTEVVAISQSAPVYLVGKSNGIQSKSRVVEYKRFAKEDAVDVRKFVVGFSQRLREVDPISMHVLRVTGIAKGEDQWEMQFSFPPHTSESQPHTLRSLLLEKPRHSLDQRITLVKHIATGIFYLHAACFVHKNVRPETIILFYNSERYPERLADFSSKDKPIIGDAYLTGFMELRHEDAQTSRVGENVPERNIYRHPQRQGIQLQTKYHILHDLYSFGTVLVEIAMWDSFRSLVDKSYGNIPLHKSIKDSKGNPRSPADIKAWFEKVAKELVPRFMGQTYADLATDCLRCVDDYEKYLELEKANSGSGDDIRILGLLAAEVKDQNGIAILHQYSRRVLEVLESIDL